MLVKRLFKKVFVLFFLVFLVGLARAVPARAILPEDPYLIGWYTVLGQKVILPNLAQKGVSFVLPYHTESTSDADIRAYLDEAERQGIKVLVDVVDTRFRAGTKTFEESLSWIKSVVETHKNHPAVWGWNMGDEPELHRPKEGPVNLGIIYNAIKAIDPSHPVVVVHWKYFYSEYAHISDVLSNDFYPVDAEGNKWNDVGEFNSSVRSSYGIWGAGIRQARSRNKKYIAVVYGQNYAHNPHMSGVRKRNLTRNDLRYHVYTAVVQGVEGILFWQHGWAVYQGDRTIETMVHSITREIQSIGQQMNNGKTRGEPGDSISVNKPASQLIYRYGAHGNRHVILAVNIDGHSNAENVDPDTVGSELNGVRFTLPVGVRPSQVKALNEPASGQKRIVNYNHSAGVIADTFNRYQVHIYEFFTGPTPTPTPACPNGSLGNLNCDSGGLINGTDLSVLLTNWHPSSPAPTPKPNYHSADLNSDNKVDGTDLSILLSNWQIE